MVQREMLPQRRTALLSLTGDALRDLRRAAPRDSDKGAPPLRAYARARARTHAHARTRDGSTCDEVLWRGTDGCEAIAAARAAASDGEGFARARPRIVLLLLFFRPELTKV